MYFEKIKQKQRDGFSAVGLNGPLGAIQTKEAHIFRRVLSVPEHAHLSRKTLDAAGTLVL